MKIPAETQAILDIFNDLLAVPAPPGSESKIAAVIQRIIHETGYQPELDPAGNVLVRFDGKNPAAGLCILAAHMDEIGFVVRTVHPDGVLKIMQSGGLKPAKIGERPVEIIGDYQTVTGVTSLGSGHAMNADLAVKWDDIRVLTGLTGEQLEKAGVRPGSTGVPLRSHCGPVLLGDPDDPLIAAWTFDDRMGVAVLLRLLQVMKNEGLTPQQPLIIAFTVQEEINAQGAIVLAHREKPEVFISVDGSPIVPDSDLKLDGRPAIWSKDRLVHFDQRLVRFLMGAAREAGTDLQPVVQPGTACDASMVFSAGAAARVADFGHVRENSHGYEVARLSVFEHVLKILVQFIRTFDSTRD